MDRDLALARRLKECLVFLSWSDEIGEVVIFDDPGSSKWSIALLAATTLFALGGQSPLPQESTALKSEDGLGHQVGDYVGTG